MNVCMLSICTAAKLDKHIRNYQHADTLFDVHFIRYIRMIFARRMAFLGLVR